jgi:flavin reductase (DIM6/NTAB) family NADH-FMN oxidoreductase RutF
MAPSSVGPVEKPIEANALKDALAAFPTGVTVITVRDANETPCGMTANAFCAVSLEPSLILVCVNRSAHTHEMIARRGSFGVNILSDLTEEISRHCARAGSDKVLRDDWLLDVSGGTPHLKDAAAYLDCIVEAAHEAGTHSIIFGRVVEVVSRSHAPLVYHRGSYKRVAS